MSKKRIPQECLDYIFEQIQQVKSDNAIARELMDRYDLKFDAARWRVKRAWKILAEQNDIDLGVERMRVSRMLERIGELMGGIDLQGMIDGLAESNIPVAVQDKILMKWDPYRAASVIMKSLDQYCKLWGLYEAEKSEVTINREAPRSLKRQERRERILELLAKDEQLRPPQATTRVHRRTNVNGSAKVLGDTDVDLN